MQEEINSDEVIEAHQLMTHFSDGFKELYVQRRADPFCKGARGSDQEFPGFTGCCHSCNDPLKLD